MLESRTGAIHLAVLRDQETTQLYGALDIQVNVCSLMDAPSTAIPARSVFVRSPVVVANRRSSFEWKMSSRRMFSSLSIGSLSYGVIRPYVAARLAI